MDIKKFNNVYWRYYKALEDDFIKTTRFVELDEDNFKTFSVEYTKQYQAICSEIDVIAKEICAFYGKNNAKTMKHYTNIILQQHDDIRSREVIMKFLPEFKLQPFIDWETDPNYNSPSWWSEYNDVKHNRSIHIKKANMENVINSLAALYLLEMYFVYDVAKSISEKINIPDTPSLLFEIRDWKSNLTAIPGGLILKHK